MKKDPVFQKLRKKPIPPSRRALKPRNVLKGSQDALEMTMITMMTMESVFSSGVFSKSIFYLFFHHFHIEDTHLQDLVFQSTIRCQIILSGNSRWTSESPRVRPR